MNITIDTINQKIYQQTENGRTCIDLYSREGFGLISHLWLKVGWNQQYTYCFTWMGRPIIQLPQDMVRIQEVIYQIKPDVIIETGVAHGGSLIFYAGLCKCLERGRVIGIDVEIRPHNRRAIEAHELFPWITLIEGDSVAPEVVSRVKSLVKPGETVMVVLDSCHTKEHVARELNAYHDLVSPGSYLVVTDGFMQALSDVPRGNPQWTWDNPSAAALDFCAVHPEFTLLEHPPWPFNESSLDKDVTHWPSAWLRRG